MESNKSSETMNGVFDPKYNEGGISNGTVYLNNYDSPGKVYLNSYNNPPIKISILKLNKKTLFYIFIW